MFYKPSGRAPGDGIAMGLVVGIAAAIPLAFVYSYAILYIPIIGVVTFILTGGFGLLLGVAAGSPMHARKVRSPLVASLVGFGVGLVALYAMWVVWLYGLLQRSDAGSEVTLLGLATWPPAVWQLMELVNQTGAWSLKGSTPTGGFLWFIWGCEALILVGMPTWLAASTVSDPFCEKCEAWCEDKQSFFLTEAVEKKQLLEWLGSGRLDQLAALPAPSTPVSLTTTAWRCGCGETATLSVIEAKPNAKGALETTDLIKHVLLPRDGFAALTRLHTERNARLGLAASPENPPAG